MPGQLPLEGLKVLELANVLAGPLVGQFCAELGAQVIKVEPPDGDPTRGWYAGNESRDSDVSAYFSSANWGKWSIALDLNLEDERHTVMRLIGCVDVVVIGYKPGDDVKFGLDYDSLRAVNPGLIYLQISAYGGGDPRPGFDAIIQAEAGFTFMNGEVQGGPVKMPVALVDLLAAHQLKEGLLLALLRRERTGQGSRIATSLLAAATASLANQASNYLVAGLIPQRMGSEHPNIVPYGNIFLTRDGRQLVVAVGTERQFGHFVEALGESGLSQDARFASNAQRVANREALVDLLSERIRLLDSTALAEAFRGARVPFGFVNDMAAVFQQPASLDQCFSSGPGVRSVALEGDIEGVRDLPAPPVLDGQRAEVLAMLDAP